MNIPLKIPIKELLRAGCSGTYSQRHMQELYRIFYSIARRTIRNKMISGKLSFDFLGLSEADITHDCIVELFTLGKDNELIELCKDFNYQRISIEDEDDEMLIVQIRRLICTVVNDNLFRLYNEADPALGKILRNIKIATGNNLAFKLVMRFDEYFLEIVKGDKLPYCKTMDDDFLHNEVCEIMSTESEIPGILEKLSITLIQQDVYQRHVRLMTLALAIKKGYEHYNVHNIQESESVDAKFVTDDAARTIDMVCSKLKEEMKPRYVDKKVCAETFELYMKVIKKSLYSEFIDGTDGQISYFDHLIDCDTGITKQEYLKNHRVIVEYLGKISKKRVRERLKEIL
ncbi:MAG: hypothetical protein HY964_02320 [Ignavibacteriales bacterium]|nr:hypothetical protein [Ignavibacteriales bacterium]